MTVTVREPLRVALFGAGRMALSHARAISRTAARATLVGIADPSPSARQAVLELAPGARAFESPGALLAALPVDVVHVCTPPATHFQVAVEALRAGCHVYVEKPFAETAGQAKELLDLAAARGLKVCAGHQLLHDSPTRIALGLLPALGPLVHVESYFSFRPVRRQPGGRVPLRPDLQLLDILPHPVYLLLRFLGEAIGGQASRISALEVGSGGTVHALIRRGNLTGALIVTLEGRPVESYVRLVGKNGSLTADYVRGTVQSSIGPGTSAIDKALAPYRLAGQLLRWTTLALGRRVLKRRTNYPGLPELLEQFYAAIAAGGLPPLSPESILETTAVCEQVAWALEGQRRVAVAHAARTGSNRRVVVTGGTGFLGKALVRTLAERGVAVRVLARREPAPWERVAGAEYVVADLGERLAPSLMCDAEAVIHAAAETAGGWAEHQRNSIDATEHVIRAAAAAGARRVIHVSSIAVLADERRGGPLSEASPLKEDSRGSGPYIWGKLESERLAVGLARDLAISVKIVRPGALVDYRDFDPPGRLGKRLGNVFVAVGWPGDHLGVTDVEFAARTLAWMLDHFDEAPDVLNVLDPQAPTKRELVRRLWRMNPDLVVYWLPMFLLVPLSWAAKGCQRLLRPGLPPIDIARVFAAPAYDTARIAALAPAIMQAAPAAPPMGSLGR